MTASSGSIRHKIKKSITFTKSCISLEKKLIQISSLYRKAGPTQPCTISVVHLNADEISKDAFEASVKKAKTRYKYEFVSSMQDATGDFILFLNSVDGVNTGWIDFLIKPLLENEGIGITGGISYYSINSDKNLSYKTLYAGVTPTPFSSDYNGLITKLEKSQLKDSEPSLTPIEVSIPSYNIVMMRKAVFDSLGGFYPFYESIWNYAISDLCMLSELKGYKNLLCTGCLVSTKDQKPKYKMTMEKGAIFAGRWRVPTEISKLNDKEIDICGSMPLTKGGEFWGDYHYANSLKKSFEKLGYKANVLFIDDWNKESTAKTVIVLRGKRPYFRSASSDGKRLIYWNISHPADVNPLELNQADYVFFASELMKSKFEDRIDSPCGVLMQCTDPSVMSLPESGDTLKPKHSPQLLFVGNSRHIFRSILKDLLPTTHELQVYGRHWEDFPEVKEHVVSEYIPNEEVARAYHDAAILLNDHWDDMREYGIISNRIFDALTAGAFIISDDVPGIREAFEGTVVTYTDRDDLAKKIDYYLEHLDERDSLAKRGKELISQKHTFDARANEIIKALEHI
ncbi:CgeB family protein [Butyrivibrio sp. WCD3002]|uniref:CgeB family protein n=1 Tax=Butyrivibrio sp. WCD3002 TaxID=1280676 RepID=UPI00041189F3|nr:glycosyltransferase [Butyrivibrio sp. WCD3002]